MTTRISASHTCTDANITDYIIMSYTAFFYINIIT